MKLLFSTVLLALVILTQSKPTPSRLYINPVAKAINGSYGDFGPYFEGDMMLTEEEVEQILTNKGALLANNKPWTNNKIPYRFYEKFPPEEEKIILEGIELFNSNLKDCIQIVPKVRADKNFLAFKKSPDTCASLVGMEGDQGQLVSMATKCLVVGTVTHELIHAAGFFHEQSRPDRDDYVEYHPENFNAPGWEDQYEKYASQNVELYNLPYDYDSIMHYPKIGGNSKIVDGVPQPILVPKQPGVEIGQRDHLSKTDIAMIRARYGCDK